MTPEQRLDRVEYILGRMAKSGRAARSEFRQKINILTNMHIQNEEQWCAQSDALSEKINILIDAQIRNEEAWRAESHATNEQIKNVAVAQAELTKAQKLTDRALRDFINSHRKDRNGR